MSPSRYAIATLSLGSCEYHRLEDKLQAASSAGFSAIELFTPDWCKYLEEFLASNHLQNDRDSRLRAAKHLHGLLQRLGLRVNCLQPIRDVEGIRTPTARAEKMQEVRDYLPICHALDTDLILCCSNTDSSASGDIAVIAKDLCEVADMAAEFSKEIGGRMIRIGYEALSWGAHVNTWKQAWNCVTYRPRENLGLIVDSFNSLGREYADPYALNGLQRSEQLSSKFLRDNLADLVETVPGNKIYLFQVADAAMPPLKSPLSRPPSPESGTPRLQPWSRNCRLFPLEQDRGAYLPVSLFTKAVLATGYKGDLSLEVFNASLNDASPAVPRTHAQRGYAALVKLESSLPATNLDTGSAVQVLDSENLTGASAQAYDQLKTNFILPSRRPESPRIPLAPLIQS